MVPTDVAQTKKDSYFHPSLPKLKFCTKTHDSLAMPLMQALPPLSYRMEKIDIFGLLNMFNRL